jgi:hypothetical protein
MTARSLVALGAIGIILTSCTPETKPVASLPISRDEWQDGENNGRWPFTIAEGVLMCHAPDWVTFTANGTEYALSDDARWKGRFSDVAPILIKGYVEIGGARQPVPTSFENVTDRGRDLCP